MCEAKNAARSPHGQIVLVCMAAVLVAGRLAFIALPPAAINLPEPVEEGQIREVPQPLEVGTRQMQFIGTNSCNLGYVNGGNYPGSVSLPNTAITAFGGWIVDSVAHNVPARVWLVLRGDSTSTSYQVPVRFFDAQPDVQEVYGGSQRYEWSGFIVQFKNQAVPPGSYHVFMVFKRGGHFVTCDNGRRLSIYE